MAAPKGNQFAKGGKGGGRPSFVDELVRAKFINGCWKWLTKNFEDFDQKQKIELATKICVKNTPQDLDLGGSDKIFEIKITRNDGKNGDNTTSTSGSSDICYK